MVIECWLRVGHVLNCALGRNSVTAVMKGWWHGRMGAVRVSECSTDVGVDHGPTCS